VSAAGEPAPLAIEFPSAELRPGEGKLMRAGKHRLAVFRLEDGRLFAVDDACPHEGYPLSRGTVKDCVLTCPWHNFKFRLDDGSCLKGDEAVATHSIAESDGVVRIEVVEPPREEQIARFQASLHEGLRELRTGQVARDAVRLLGLGVEPVQLAALCAVHDARHAEYGTSHATAVATDVCRYFERHQGVDAVLPLMQAFELCAMTHVRRPMREVPLAVDPGDDPVAAGERLLQLLENEDLDDAEAVLRGAIERGWQREVIEPWLLRACSMHWIGFGHGLIYVTKTFDLLALAGWQHATHLLPATLLSLGSMTREDQVPEWLWFRRRLDELRPRLGELWTRQSETGASATDELLETVLDGRREQAFDAITAALGAGVGVRSILGVLSVAASERIVRFDTDIDANPEIQNGWLTVTHALTYTAAARAAITRLPSAELLTMLYFSMRLINASQVLDMPAERRFRSSSNGSASGSLEALVERVAKRDAQGALDELRAYLRSGQPIEPVRAWADDLALKDGLTQPLVVGHLIKTAGAAFDEYLILAAAGAEHAARPLEAIVRLASSPIQERRVARLSHEAIRFVVDGKVPRALV
jgi:nitrite reductase/ring-hydroxylating ferredoxin subunit